MSKYIMNMNGKVNCIVIEPAVAATMDNVFLVDDSIEQGWIFSDDTHVIKPATQQEIVDENGNPTGDFITLEDEQIIELT